MSNQDGLICAVALDGEGRGHRLDWDGLSTHRGGKGFLWIHLDYTAERAQDWISNEADLHTADIDALLKEETRPRSAVSRDGLLVVLRGVNLNPGAQPEDMVALRIWLNGQRVITTRYRRHRWEADMLEAIETGEGPVTPGEFLVMVTELIVGRIHEVVQDVEDQVDVLEETMLEQESQAVRTALADIRRQTINLRRYLAPQREALAGLQSEKIGWLSDADRLHLREVHDKMVRVVEDLDAARERATVGHEELGNRMAEQLNQRMYMLSMIAAMFMPLTFLTGLLGINVGGIPGADNKEAFLWVCVILGGIGIALYLMFRKRRWM